MERYKSFSFSLLPFATAFLGLYAYSKALASGKSFDFLSDQNLLLIMIFIVVLCGMIMLATNWWINSFYGKYAKKIGQILVELKEE